MKQIKSNNWLDLLVRFLLASNWFRVGVLSGQEIQPGTPAIGVATKPIQEGKRGTFPSRTTVRSLALDFSSIQ